MSDRSIKLSLIAHLEKLRSLENSTGYYSDKQRALIKVVTGDYRFKESKDLLEYIFKSPTTYAYEVETNIIETFKSLADGLLVLVKDANVTKEFVLTELERVFKEFNTNKEAWKVEFERKQFEEKYKAIEEGMNKINEIPNILNNSKEEIKKVSKLHNDLVLRVEEFEQRYASSIAKLENLYQQDKFEGHSKRFQIVGIVWLLLAIASAVFLFVYINRYFVQNINEWTYVTELQKLLNNQCEECKETVIYLELFKAIAFRVLVISILFYALTFCVKNYNAQMHNYAVNLHKSNSLYASGVLINNSMISSSARDGIASRAANSIFQQQPTGYNQKELTPVNNLAEEILSSVKKN
jgi:hypothetical protein